MKTVKMRDLLLFSVNPLILPDLDHPPNYDEHERPPESGRFAVSPQPLSLVNIEGTWNRKARKAKRLRREGCDGDKVVATRKPLNHSVTPIGRY